MMLAETKLLMTEDIIIVVGEEFAYTLLQDFWIQVILVDIVVGEEFAYTLLQDLWIPCIEVILVDSF